MIKPGLLMLLGLALAGCAENLGGGACGLKLAGEASLGLAGTIPLAEISVGSAHASFLLDTGSTHTLVRATTAKRFNAALVEGGSNQFLGNNGPTVTKVAELKGAMLGSVALADMRVAVPPDAELVSVARGGLIGMDIMGKYEVDLDLPARRVRFYTGSPCANEALPIGNALTNIRGEWTRLFAVNDADPRPYIRATVDGQPVSALLDSGSTRSVLYADMASGLGVTPAMLSKDAQNPIRGVGATQISARLHRLHEVRVGAVALPDLDVWVMDRAYPNDSAMVIGGDYLAHHRIWLALKRHAIFVPAN